MRLLAHGRSQATADGADMRQLALRGRRFFLAHRAEVVLAAIRHVRDRLAISTFHELDDVVALERADVATGVDPICIADVLLCVATNAFGLHRVAHIRSQLGFARARLLGLVTHSAVHLGHLAQAAVGGWRRRGRAEEVLPTTHRHMRPVGVAILLEVADDLAVVEGGHVAAERLLIGTRDQVALVVQLVVNDLELLWRVVFADNRD